MQGKVRVSQEADGTGGGGGRWTRRASAVVSVERDRDKRQGKQGWD